MKLFKTVVAGLALTMAVSAHADLNVGVILSLTGPAASLGIPARNAIQLWPKEIAGQKLNVTVLDDASDPTAATLAAKKLTTENQVDVIVGPSVTPTSLAALQVAGDAGTPIITLAGGNAIIYPAEGARRWAFKLPPSEEIQLKLVYDDLKKKGLKRLAVVAVGNAYGQTFLDVAQKTASQAGIEIVDVQRYAATDASFVAQSLKVLSVRPDAVFIAAAGTPALLPQLELRSRAFAGPVYQTQAVANNDFLRLGGPRVEGTLLPVSPMLVAEQLAATNPIRATAVAYVAKYEAANGPASRSLFGGTAWDAYLLIEAAATPLLKSSPPGTPAFRTGVRDALEKLHDMVLTEGIYSMSVADHNGADARSQVLVTIRDGRWQLAPD